MVNSPKPLNFEAHAGERNGAATDPLLTIRDVARVLACSIPTVWRRVADGGLPKPLKLGHLSRWPRSEILAVIEQAKIQRGENQK